MNAGLPGTGIGGIFYLASALAMPLREAYRRVRGRAGGRWRIVGAQLAIAGGILGAMWLTGLLLGHALAAARPITTPGGALPPGNLLRTASLALGLGTLAAVLAGVELLRLWVHRGKRPASRASHESPPRLQAPSAARPAKPRVTQQWERMAPLLVLTLAAAADPEVATAQSPLPVAGRMARADSAWAAGDTAVAAREFAAVLAADPDNSHATYRLAQLTRGDPSEALRLFQRYVELEPDDPWGYMAEGEALARAGRYRDALRSYDNALRLAPGEPEAVAGRAKVFARSRAAAPAVTPLVSGSRDSDGNSTFHVGGSAELAAQGSLRLGVEANRDRVTDGVATAGLAQIALRAAWRPSRLASVDAALGGTRLERSDSRSTTVAPTGRVRARWRSSAHGPTVDLRAQRGVLAASPLLVNNRVVRTELRAVVEIPVTRTLKLRGLGRTALLRDTADLNHRTALGGVVAVALSPVIELSGQVHEIRYSHASTAGYFAPRLGQVVEAGSYVELESPGGWLFALDVGAGAQRVAEFGGQPGAWSRSLRWYSLITAPLAPGRALQLELEGEDSMIAREAATTGAWRYGSVALSLRWAL
ncbi:MAG TPA: tetratricopeptide repeat protein [Gemmatimonadales bacterium]|nr:tetratricopeptide repeat protein [Gemmatimonadales bacterium]